MVEIQGAVAAPGMYSFPGNARVYDALEKAGGASENAEIRDINIAATLLDGSVLSIPYRQNDGQIALPGAADLNPPAYTRSGWRESPSGKVGPGSATSREGVPDSPAKVNINTATQAELETLPGVGEKTAEKIMRHRETQPFTHVDDLGFVQGIGEKRLETLRPHVTVE
jgi:competence protein ComEA